MSVYPDVRGVAVLTSHRLQPLVGAHLVVLHEEPHAAGDLIREFLPVGPVQPVCLARGVDAAFEEDLVRVDVADAGDDRLVEEAGLDRAAAAAEAFLQVLRGQGRVVGFGAEIPDPARVLIIRAEQPEASEAAHVREA